MSLIEALNGPCITRQPPSAMPDLVETPDSEHAIQAAQILNRCIGDKSPLKTSNPEVKIDVFLSLNSQELSDTLR